MTAPTAATLAMLRSNLPVKRVASPSSTPSRFASLLKTASVARPPALQTTAQTTQMNVPQRAATFHSAMLDAAAPSQFVAGGPSHLSRSDIVKNAAQLLNVPYVWGGTANSGLDCSAFVSKVWGVARHTTDNLSAVSHAISKDQLQQGDALNLTTSNDADGAGHVRLFDRWADAAHTKMYVYEETPPRSIHHVINWDPKYQPMRRNNVVDA
jgi:cell wall-associated NlpC family hydrolase